MNDVKLPARCPHCGVATTDVYFNVGRHRPGCPAAVYRWPEEDVRRVAAGELPCSQQTEEA